MTGHEHCFLSLAEAGRLVQRKDLSPVELTREHLDQIAAVEPQVHAYITVLADAASQDARRAEEEVLRGEYRGPLHGVPVAVKDLFNTGGGADHRRLPGAGIQCPRRGCDRGGATARGRGRTAR